MDVVEVRKASQLGIMSGIDKRKIAQGRDAIDISRASRICWRTAATYPP